ncbi:MAG: STAS domain-containing protein [Cyclobacteriaceae bacterium]
MDISNLVQDDIYVIKISGDVDASSSIFLDEAISEAISKGQSKILIDCRELEYISSAGLGVFMSYIEEVNTKQISLIIFGLSEKVENVFKVLGLDQLLNIVDTEESAKEIL